MKKSTPKTNKRHEDEKTHNQSFFHFIEQTATRLRQMGKTRTSETYTAALNSFRRFRQDKDVRLCDIDSDLMEEYEAYLHSRDVCPNTISFYNRILRAAYNRAVTKLLTTQRNPFRNVYTGNDKTTKRAITLDAIRRIKQLDLAHDATLDLARDLFMFSFYTRGMSFVDMAYLRHSNLRDGTLTYRRRKTGQQLHIRWEQCMQDIIDRHPNTATDHLLPIITRPPTLGGDGAQATEKRQYESALHLVNRKLKTVARMAGLTVPLTMYVSRHSWASIAKWKNIPIAVISEGMGHDSELTTRIYLASLDASVVDSANELIIRELQ